MVMVESVTDQAIRYSNVHMETKMKSTIRITVAALGLAALSLPALAGDDHGHCSGANVCAGDAACEKQGYKELTKDECAKIDGAKFEASSHRGEDHKDGDHDKHGHDKK